MILLRLVGRELGVVKMAPKNSQEPNSRETRLRVLARPAEARRLRQRLFHDRRGIDEDLDSGSRGLRDSHAASSFSLPLIRSW